MQYAVMNEFRKADGKFMSKFLEIFYKGIQSNILSLRPLSQ